MCSHYINVVSKCRDDLFASLRYFFIVRNSLHFREDRTLYVRTLHRYCTCSAGACSPSHAAVFVGFVGSLHSPASLPPPHLLRRIFKVFDILRCEYNMIQGVAEHLSALPNNMSDLSAQNQTLRVRALHRYRMRPTDACSPTHSPRTFCQFLTRSDDSTWRAEHTQVCKTWLYVMQHLVRGAPFIGVLAALKASAHRDMVGTALVSIIRSARC